MKQQYQSYYLDSPLVKGRVFDVFVPEEITKDVAVLFVHGGGWRFGSRESFHEIMEALNNRGFVAASTDYRLYAKDAFQQLSDIRAAYMRFVSVLKEMGRPAKIAVYGESAGSHLASLLLFAKPGECGEEIDEDWNGDLCKCVNCSNDGIDQPRRRYIDFDDIDDEYCEDGIPDVNQGWISEHYG